MTLLVRDEEDVIRSNLDHHLDQGVDHVLVTDNGSVDATLDLLAPYERAGVVEVIHEPADDYAQAKWVTRMARRAAERGADWVLNNDADEFWFATSGTVRDALASVPPEYGVVVAHRSDMVARPEDGRPFWQRMVHRRVVSTNALGKPLPPKVCHRGDPTVRVRQGNHRATGKSLGAVLDDGRLEILHYPERSYDQFANKIAKGGAAYERNTELSENVGSTWRWLYELYRDGQLREWYDQQVVDDGEAERELGKGVLVEDTRLVRALERLGSTAR